MSSVGLKRSEAVAARSIGDAVQRLVSVVALQSRRPGVGVQRWVRVGISPHRQCDPARLAGVRPKPRNRLSVSSGRSAHRHPGRTVLHELQRRPRATYPDITGGVRFGGLGDLAVDPAATARGGASASAAWLRCLHSGSGDRWVDLHLAFQTAWVGWLVPRLSAYSRQAGQRHFGIDTASLYGNSVVSRLVASPEVDPRPRLGYPLSQAREKKFGHAPIAMVANPRR